MKREIENTGASGPRQKRAVETASSCTGSSGTQEGQAKPKVVERPKPEPLPLMKEWLSVKDLTLRVAAVTAPPDCSLPASNNQEPRLFLTLPSELLNMIVSAEDARVLALTCRQVYRHFDQRFPLMRLEALAKLLFPADSNRYPSRVMVEHMQRLLQKQGGLDQTLYTPLDASLRAALTLAFLAAIPLSNDPDPTTLKMLTTVREGVSALGDAALVAASDLIDEYIRQSDAVSEVSLKHVDSSSRSGIQPRILPTLLPLLQNAPQEHAQKLLWDMARFQVRFPYYGFRDLLMQLFKSRPQVFSAEIFLFLNAATRFDGASLPALNAHEKVQAAHHCLAEFTQMALAANGQLRRTVSTARPGKVWKQYVSNRARGSCSIAAMISNLKLSPEDEQALIPKHLRLLEIQLDNLAMLNRLSPLAKRQERYLKLTDWLNGALENWPEEPLAQDIASRIGELTRLAIKWRDTQPELIAKLGKIIQLWPDERSREVALKWFQEKALA